jgi:hypothetical protein
VPGAELSLEIDERALDLDVHELLRAHEQDIGRARVPPVAHGFFQAHGPRGARCRGDGARQLELAGVTQAHCRYGVQVPPQLMTDGRREPAPLAKGDVADASFRP